MTLQYACPHCQTELEWRSDNPYRPFCSERCKNHDLCGWANEEHTIAGDPLLDEGELFSGLLEEGKLPGY